MRTTSTGGDEFNTFAAGLELQRKLENGQNIMWDIINQGTLNIRRNTNTLFMMSEDVAQFGTQASEMRLHVLGNLTVGEIGSVPNASVGIKSDTWALDLQNDNESWKIGVSDDEWAVNAGKLVFSNSNSSNDALMVLTKQGRVGIGITLLAVPWM